MQINLTLHPPSKRALATSLYAGFNRKMQGTTVMNNNFKGEELEKYSSLANNFQTRASQMILAPGPTIPKSITDNNPG